MTTLMLESLINKAKERIQEEASTSSKEWEAKIAAQYGQNRNKDHVDEAEVVSHGDDKLEPKDNNDEKTVKKDTHDDEEKVHEEADEKDEDGDKEKVREETDDEDKEEVKEESDEDDKDDLKEEKGEDGDDMSEEVDDEDKKEVKEDDTEAKEKSTMTDVKEAMDALFAGAKLTKSFKTKATTIFEAALKSKVKEAAEAIQEESKKDLDARMAKLEESTDEQVEQFLEHVVGKFITENKVAIDQGIKTDFALRFMDDMKSLFESYNVSLPTEKVDILEQHIKENKDLKTENNTLTEQVMAKDAEILKYKKAEVISKLSEGLATTQVEKFKKLTEDVEAKDVEVFTEKAQTIKESFFSAKKIEETKKPTQTKETVVLDDGVHKNIQHYAQHIIKNKSE